MLEIKLIAVFAVCAAVLFIGGFAAVRSARNGGNSLRLCILLPVGGGSEDVEFLVRSCVYKAAGQYPEAAVILCDLGAGEETVRIFETLMRHKCRYYVADPRECQEKVCKIINSVV